MEKFAHAAMDGGRRLAMKLLIEDRFKQRLKGRWQCIKAQAEFAHLLDQCAQLRVACLQVVDCLRRIEWKFPALSVMKS